MGTLSEPQPGAPQIDQEYTMHQNISVDSDPGASSAGQEHVAPFKDAVIDPSISPAPKTAFPGDNRAEIKANGCTCESSSHIMANSIKNIQDILLAVARESNVRMPQNAIEHTLLQPKTNAYDLSATVEYIVKCLPPDTIIQSAVDWIKSEQWPERQDDIQWTGNVPRRLPYDLSQGGGQKSLFSWGDKKSCNSADLVERNTVELSEYGYDETGHLCLLGEYGGHGRPKNNHRPYGFPDRDKPPIVEHIFIDAEGTTPAWKGQRFGKEWLLSCGSNVDAEQLAILFSQVCIHDLPATTYVLLQRPELGRYRSEHSASNIAVSFFHQFARHWDSAHTRLYERRLEWLATGLEEHGEQVCIAAYHLRVISARVQQFIPQSPQDTALNRTIGSLRAPTTEAWMDIVETRFSTVLKTTTQRELPIFVILNASDAIGTYNLVPLTGGWEAAGIQTHAGAAGYAAFAYRIRLTSELWAEEWATTLDDLDMLLRVDLRTVLSHNARMRLMIDDVGSGFALSEFYFAALRFLRIASEWVQEANDNLQELVLGLKKSYTAPGSPPELNEAATLAFNQTWENILAHQQHLAKPLLARIARKQAELNSLKDGLFNATSVSEANRSTRLNHYIMVFTVVTIFYLPLSFVAALFALGLFSWDNPGQNGAFIATSVAVAVGTYCFSGLLIWVVGRSRVSRLQFFRGVANRVLTLLGRVGFDVELDNDHWLVRWLDPGAAD